MKNSFRPFAGRIVVVTGAAQGIGLQCAIRFAELGATVHACDVKPHASALAAGAHTGHIFPSLLDVSTEDSVQNFFESDAVGGGIDVLVNCAGIQRFGDALQTTLETWNRVLQVNVTGAFLVSRAAVPLMRKRGGGSIINVSSIHARLTAGGRVAYVTSKAALLGLTRALSLDHAGEGIRVNVVLPGAIETPMLTEGWSALRPDRTEEQMRDAVASSNPLGRLGTPDDIADAILFLASPAASFITGAELVVDGGVVNKLALPVAPIS